MRSVFALAIACALLAACASTGGEKPVASRADANTLAARQTLSKTAASDAAWPATDWWKRYGDEQLDALVDEALKGSPTLRAADARLRKAVAAAGIASSARKLQLNGSADISRQRFSEHYIFPPPFGGSWNTPADLGANFSFDLDLFARLRSAYEGALDQAHAAEVDRQAARLLLSTSIVRAYVQLQGAYDQLDIARAQLADRQNLVNLVEQRKAAGLDSDVELRQAQVGIPEAQERIAQLEETIDLTRHQVVAVRSVLELYLRMGDQVVVPDRVLGSAPQRGDGGVCAVVLDAHHRDLPDLPGLGALRGDHHDRHPAHVALRAAGGLDLLDVVAYPLVRARLVLSLQCHVTSQHGDSSPRREARNARPSGRERPVERSRMSGRAGANARSRG